MLSNTAQTLSWTCIFQLISTSTLTQNTPFEYPKISGTNSSLQFSAVIGLSPLPANFHPDRGLVFHSRAPSKPFQSRHYSGTILCEYGRRHESLSRQASRQALGGHRRERSRTISIVCSFFPGFSLIFLIPEITEETLSSSYVC